MDTNFVKIWTIQRLPVLRELESSGIYRPSPQKVIEERLCAEELSPEEDPFYQSYLWLANEMEKRITPHRPVLRDSSLDLKAMPIWGWQQWGGPDSPMPDLRSTGHLMPGTQGVRLELVIDKSRVLLSDFDLWFFPFGGIYLGKNLKEDKAFDLAKKKAGIGDTRRAGYNLTLPDPLLRSIHKSWQRVFNLKFYRPGYNCGKRDKVVQATFWEIKTEDIVKKTFFTAR